MSVSNCTTIAVKKQVDKDTQATGTFKSTEFKGTDIGGNGELLDGEVNNGYRAQSRTLRGKYEVGGGLQMLSNPSGVIPVLIEGMMGNVVTTALGGGAYQHVFSATTGCAELDYYSIWVDKLAMGFMNIGCKVGGVTLAIDTPGLVTMDFSIMGLYDKSTTAPTIQSFNPTPFTWADAAVTIDSVADTTIENFSAELTNNLDPRYALNNQVYPNSIQEKALLATGSFTKEFINSDQYETFWGLTGATQVQRTVKSANYVIAFTSLDQIAASGQYYSMEFDFAKVYLSEIGSPIPYNDTIIQDISFKADVDTTTGKYITITIVNDEATI